MTLKPCHFYVAFNPLFNQASRYKTQAHEFYDVLKKKVNQNKKSYLYWGKISVSNYSEPLDLEHFRSVLRKNTQQGLDTHLYISDYQHLWIGKVVDVVSELKDPNKTLDFYRGKNVDIWFKISDFDLIHQDKNATKTQLSNLFVDSEYYPYKVKKITPLSSGLRFPMIVQEKVEEKYFTVANMKSSRRIETENKYIASSSGNISRSYVMPEQNFAKLPESVRIHLMRAEILLVESTQGGQNNRAKLKEAVSIYLMCLEILLNETFIKHLKKEQGHRISVSQRRPIRFLRTSFTRDQTEFMSFNDTNETFSLGQIKMLLDAPAFFSHTTMDWVFRHKKSFWDYCRHDLRQIFKNESLAELKSSLERNETVTTSDRELLFIRNILLGIGDKGVFNEIIETNEYINSEATKTA